MGVEGKKRLLKWISRLFLLGSVLVLVGMVLDFGFDLGTRGRAIWERVDFVVLVFFFFQYPIRLLLADNRKHFLRRYWFQGVVVLFILLEMIWMSMTYGYNVLSFYFSDLRAVLLTKITVVVTQALLLATIIGEALHMNRRVARLRFHPAQTMLLSFLLVILAGALMLMMPKSLADGAELSFVDALFTATSATCVTGLAVVDTGTHFTRNGQIILLVLIQIGGLGLMTLSSFLALFFAGGVGLRERVLLMDMLNLDRLSAITGTLRSIVFLTLIVEGIGAFFLFLFCRESELLFEDRVFHAVFHSVSAFCNAGFSLNSDSLVGYSKSPGVLFTFSFLIIIGGLGFGVIQEVLKLPRKKIKGGPYRRHFSVQSKVVLLTTASLLVGGMILFMFLTPWREGIMTQLMDSWFNSVTTRTAGFNHVDFAAFGISATMVVCFLMFVGASPGSTGGGMKTSTLAILLGSMYSTLKGRRRITMFYRNIPSLVVHRALIIFSFSITMLGLFLFALTITEEAPFLDIIFEVVSAFSTTGLSRGLTGDLSTMGRIILCFAMFTGRLGPLTLAFAVTVPRGDRRVEYPDETLMVG